MGNYKELDIRGVQGERVTPRAGWNGETWDDGGNFTWGRWDQRADGKWLIPTYSSGSDYSSSCLVEVSNFEVLKEACAKCKPHRDGAFYVTLSGGYGTFGLAFHIGRTPGAIREMLAGLENYPLIDEEAHSQLEHEKTDEAWDNWAAADFRRALEKKFQGDADAISADSLFDIFSTACDASNTYWENESADNMYIDMDRVVSAVEEAPAGFIPESED